MYQSYALSPPSWLSPEPSVDEDGREGLSTLHFALAALYPPDPILWRYWFFAAAVFPFWLFALTQINNFC